eukprot:5752455-Prorocentrum_lima.AAC.1
MARFQDNKLQCSMQLEQTTLVRGICAADMDDMDGLLNLGHVRLDRRGFAQAGLAQQRGIEEH